ncbi:comEA protein [Allopseudospirillum japonicum]|uniref:ComEA protein n=1 Tax=Allopseudospirillum japonicum TaxID=64971 RepID=A0A1H6RYV3_9GAMM|nr:ComEA family DNA-binding protein [Allopseudospirillum japonicum]SEI60861.1 comEA protein [Allopseudospirillum japonicum]
MPVRVLIFACCLLLGVNYQAHANPVTPSASQVSTTSALSTQSQAESSLKLDLNQVTLAELEQLKGIGPKKAQAILEYRQQIGGFQRVEDLIQVKGIGPALLETHKASFYVKPMKANPSTSQTTPTSQQK